MYFPSRGARALLPDVAGESGPFGPFDNSSNVCAANDELKRFLLRCYPPGTCATEVEERRVRARSGADHWEQG